MAGHFAGPHGRRGLLFINNPHATGYRDEHGFTRGYDILTATDRSSYTVPVNRKSVEAGDVAVVYRVDQNARHRDPGNVVAIAGITSNCWIDRDGYGQVNWHVKVLPPELWIPASEMKASGHWTKRSPFTDAKMASAVELNHDQWDWIFAKLPKPARDWMASHAKF